MKPRSKQVLFVSYHFPPSPAVGGLRIVNFAKNLPEYGWEPHVLTLPEDEGNRDETHLGAVSEVHVVRVRPWPTLSDGYRFAKRMLKRDRSVPTATAPALPAGSHGSSGGVAQRIRRFLLSLLSVPDGERGWIVPAAVQGLWSVRRSGCSCIVTSCPPYSVHLVGLLLKLFSDVRWIADFRDPWMSGGRKALYMTSRLSLSLDRWLERKVVQHADVIVANTSALTASLTRGYPQIASTKFVTITNSIDLDAFAPFWSLPKEPILTVAYAGSFYFNRTPEPVFAAVRKLIDEGRLAPEAVRIALAGQCEMIAGTPTIELARRYGVQDLVTLHGQLSHTKALRLIRTSHVALLLAPTQPNQIPAKAYDYVGLGTEILALASAGATADLVRTHNVGSVFEPDDVTGIAAFLEAASMRMAARDAGRPAAAAAFDARLNTRRLAALLEDAPAMAAVREVAV